MDFNLYAVYIGIRCFNQMEWTTRFESAKCIQDVLKMYVAQDLIVCNDDDFFNIKLNNTLIEVQKIN